MSSAPAPLTVFVGQYYSGSWSAVEALMAAMGADRCYNVDAHTLAKPGELPSLQQDMEFECARMVARPRAPEFINTHRSLPFHLVIKDREVRYATMLRNPQRRFISYYHWCGLYKDQNFHWISPVIRDGATLEEYTDHVAKTGLYPGGLRPCEYFVHPWAELDLIPEAHRRNHFLAGRYILETYFPIVGITEMFDESLFVLSRFLGLEAPARWRMRGKSGAGGLSSVPENVMAKIRVLMQFDMTLYTVFVNRFLERHRADIELFKSLGISLRIDGDEDRIGGGPGWTTGGRDPLLHGSAAAKP